VITSETDLGVGSFADTPQFLVVETEELDVLVDDDVVGKQTPVALDKLLERVHRVLRVHAQARADLTCPPTCQLTTTSLQSLHQAQVRLN